MFKSLRSSLYVIGLSAAITIVAILAFALWSFDSLGKSAAQAQASSAVVANVLPPPLYLIETRLVLSQVVEGSLPVATGKDVLQRLARENRLELDVWSGQGSEELRSLIAKDVAQTSRDIFAAAPALVAAVEAGDLGQARRQLDAVQTLYQAHRQAIDKTVAVGRELERSAIADFDRTRQGGIWALIAIALAFMFAAALSYARALRSVLIPVQACVELANRVADGDLHEAAAPDRTDELGTLQSALGRMTVKLAASRESLVRARDAAEQAGGEGRLPGEHEPRNPHADERRARADPYRASHEPGAQAARLSGEDTELGQVAAAHHQRRAGLLEDRSRQAGAGIRTLPARPCL